MRNCLYLCLGLAAYVATLIVSQMILAHLVGSHATNNRFLGICLTLSPMVPAVFVCASLVRTIRRMDEMQRQLQLEALAIAFAGTAFLTFGYGFLEGTGMPRLSMFVVWPVMAGLWCLGLVFGQLRFR